MAEKIEWYLKTPDPVISLKSNCRAEVLKKYSWEMVTDKIEEELDLVWKNK